MGETIILKERNPMKFYFKNFIDSNQHEIYKINRNKINGTI